MWLGLWVALLSPASGAPPDEPVVEAGAVDLIARAVAAHGLAGPGPLDIRFRFRGTPYRLRLDGRDARYERRVTQKDGRIRVDRLRGADFVAEVDGRPLPLDERQAGALRRSLNSVAYFALLPRPLQDDAVIARDLGPSTLRGRTWLTLEVRFREEGGGDDHEDVFRYWIDPETHRLGYLAYTFDTNDGGVRLREVIGTHEVGGLVLLDWANYGLDGRQHTLDDAVQAFEAGALPRLSEIRLEDVAVGPAAEVP